MSQELAGYYLPDTASRIIDLNEVLLPILERYASNTKLPSPQRMFFPEFVSIAQKSSAMAWAGKLSTDAKFINMWIDFRYDHAPFSFKGIRTVDRHNLLTVECYDRGIIDVKLTEQEWLGRYGCSLAAYATHVEKENEIRMTELKIEKARADKHEERRMREEEADRQQNDMIEDFKVKRFEEAEEEEGWEMSDDEGDENDLWDSIDFEGMEEDAPSPQGASSSKGASNPDNASSPEAASSLAPQPEPATESPEPTSDDPDTWLMSGALPAGTAPRRFVSPAKRLHGIPNALLTAERIYEEFTNHGDEFTDANEKMPIAFWVWYSDAYNDPEIAKMELERMR